MRPGVAKRQRARAEKAVIDETEACASQEHQKSVVRYKNGAENLATLASSVSQKWDKRDLRRRHGM